MFFRACGHSIGGVHNVNFPAIGLYSHPKTYFKANNNDSSREPTYIRVSEVSSRDELV